MHWMEGLTVRGQNGLKNTMELTNIQIISITALKFFINSQYLRFEHGACYFGDVQSPFIGKKGWQEIINFITKH